MVAGLGIMVFTIPDMPKCPTTYFGELIAMLVIGLSAKVMHSIGLQIIAVTSDFSVIHSPFPMHLIICSCIYCL